MNVNEATEICPDFVPYTDPSTGALRCKCFARETKTCALASRDGMSCLVLEHVKKLKERTKVDAPKKTSADIAKKSYEDDYPIPPELKGETIEFFFSYSRIRTFLQCPYKYYLRYIEKVEVPTPMYFKFGTAFHKAIESVIRDGAIEFESTGDEFQDAKLRGMLEGVMDKIPIEGNLKTEEPFSFASHGKRLVRGKIDLYDVDRKIVYDHKTTDDVNDYPILGTAYQFAVYGKAIPEAEEFIVNLFGKSKLRPKKGESAEEYGNRIKADAEKNPDKYYRKAYYARSEINVDRRFDEMMYLVDHILTLENFGKFIRNPSACSIQECEYKKFCISKL